MKFIVTILIIKILPCNNPDASNSQLLGRTEKFLRPKVNTHGFCQKAITQEFVPQEILS